MHRPASGMNEQPEIVFLHGAFGSGADFDAWMRHFAAAGYACRAPSLPGHDPADPSALRRLRVTDYTRFVEQLVLDLDAPPVLVGHSMGGVVAQQVAATLPCRALVCIGSANGMLIPQAAALPALVRLLPPILMGRPFRAPPATIRALALRDLPADEQARLAVRPPESGRAFRQLLLGTTRVDPRRVRCPVLCVSGTDDLIVSQRLAERLAADYRAEHLRFARGHWLIAPSAVHDVGAAVMRWIRARLAEPPPAAAATPNG